MKLLILFCVMSLGSFGKSVERVLQKDVKVYPTRTHVKEKLLLKEDGKSNEIRYVDVSKGLDLSTISLEGAKLNGSDLIFKNRGNILENYKNEIVKVEKDGVIREYKLLDTKNGLLFEDLATGSYVIGYDGRLLLPKKDILGKDTLIISAENIKDRVALSYGLNGINWNVSHTLNEDTNKLESWAKITNHLDRDMKDINLTLYIGKTRANFYRGRPEMAMAKSSDMAYKAPKKSNTNDYIEYKIPNKVNLHKGAVKNLKLEENRVSLKKKYRYYSTSYDKNADKIYLIKNLGNKIIPSGRFFFVKNNIVIGETNLDFIGKKEEKELLFGKTFNINVEKKILKNRKKSSKELEREFEFTIKNRSKEKVQLEFIFNQLPINHKKLKSNAQYKKEGNNLLKYNIKLKPLKEEKIRISYIEELRVYR